MREIGLAVLFCGDAREITILDTPGAVITDPPYGMAFQSNYRKVKHDEIAGDGDAELLRWACELPVLHSRYVFMRWENLYDIPRPRSLMHWAKNNHGMGDLEHEIARGTEQIAFWPGPEHSWPVRRPHDIVKSARTGNKLHPTEKPVDLMGQLISFTAGCVFDPFMGSGSTGVAAVKAGRSFIGCEINPEYYEIACQRIDDAQKQGDLF